MPSGRARDYVIGTELLAWAHLVPGPPLVIAALECGRGDLSSHGPMVTASCDKRPVGESKRHWKSEPLVAPYPITHNSPQPPSQHPDPQDWPDPSPDRAISLRA